MLPSYWINHHTSLSWYSAEYQQVSAGITNSWPGLTNAFWEQYQEAAVDDDIDVEEDGEIQ